MDTEPRPLRVAYIGNFSAPHSTENHIRRALVHNGHGVIALQENDVRSWSMIIDLIINSDVDLILWTRTGWDWHSVFGRPDSNEVAKDAQGQMLKLARRLNIPTVGYHLDIWFGLEREHLVNTERFFSCDVVITADGGHDEEFAGKGVEHVWFPPGVSLAECQLGTRRDEFASKLAFVGSHDGGYHKEHQHRHELVAWLKKNFRRDCVFYPQPGQHAVRGKDLQDLYASVDVVIGDSCFAGTGLANYWSDRIPETIGRGGFLLHPDVPGIEDHFVDGRHLELWQAGNWDELGNTIQLALDDPEHRQITSALGRAHVLEYHTYEVRMKQLVDLLNERSLIS